MDVVADNQSAARLQHAEPLRFVRGLALDGSRGDNDGVGEIIGQRDVRAVTLFDVQTRTEQTRLVGAPPQLCDLFVAGQLREDDQLAARRQRHADVAGVLADHNAETTVYADLFQQGARRRIVRRNRCTNNQAGENQHQTKARYRSTHTAVIPHRRTPQRAIKCLTAAHIEKTKPAGCTRRELFKNHCPANSLPLPDSAQLEQLTKIRARFCLVGVDS